MSERTTSVVSGSPRRGLPVVVLSTGRVRGKRTERGVRRYLPGGWSERTMPVNVIAIEHPSGTCLFDTGQTAQAAEPGYFPWWFPYFRLARFELSPGDEAAAQLPRSGIPPASVKWVVLSHLHTDHAGGIGGFRGAEVMVSRAEWERATDLAGRLRLRGYLQQHWPQGLDPRLVDFDGPPVGPFPGSHDLAGDGRLLLVPTPGHTPGHMSLLVTGSEGGFLCAGDLVERAGELDRVAPDVAEFCAREGIAVLAAHDPSAAQRLEAPAA